VAKTGRLWKFGFCRDLSLDLGVLGQTRPPGTDQSSEFTCLDKATAFCNRGSERETHTALRSKLSSRANSSTCRASRMRTMSPLSCRLTCFDLIKCCTCLARGLICSHCGLRRGRNAVAAVVFGVN
jgi:hypothetical protein